MRCLSAARVLTLVCLYALAVSAPLAAGTFRPRAGVAPPSITPFGGHYDINSKVMITIRGESGAYLVYTLDGSIPVEGKSRRSESNLVELELPQGDVVVKAVAKKPGLPASGIRQAMFTRSAEGR